MKKMLALCAAIVVACTLGATPAMAYPVVNSVSNIGVLTVGAKTATSGTVIPLAGGAFYLNITAVVLTKGQCADIGKVDGNPASYCASRKTLSIPLGAGTWEVERTQ